MNKFFISKKYSIRLEKVSFVHTHLIHPQSNNELPTCYLIVDGNPTHLYGREAQDFLNQWRNYSQKVEEGFND